MKSMKKLAAILGAMTCALVLSGCPSDSGDGAAETSQTDASSETE